MKITPFLSSIYKHLLQEKLFSVYQVKGFELPPSTGFRLVFLSWELAELRERELKNRAKEEKTAGGIHNSLKKVGNFEMAVSRLICVIERK